MGRSWSHSGTTFPRADDPVTSESPERRVAILCWLFLIFVVGLSFLYLMQAKDVSSIGYEIRKLEGERLRLLEQNAQLSLEISELQALRQIRARATRLGLGPPERIGYIRLSGSQEW